MRRGNLCRGECRRRDTNCIGHGDPRPTTGIKSSAKENKIDELLKQPTSVLGTASSAYIISLPLTKN